MVESIDVHSQDDRDLRDGRVGTIYNIKGKLENVRFGGGQFASDETGQRRARGHNPRTNLCADPGLVIAFADWSMVAVTVRDYATAKGVRIPLGTYVCVKAQKIHEDGDLMALAIWELGGKGTVQPLGDPIGDVPSDTTR